MQVEPLQMMWALSKHAHCPCTSQPSDAMPVQASSAWQHGDNSGSATNKTKECEHTPYQLACLNLEALKLLMAMVLHKEYPATAEHPQAACKLTGTHPAHAMCA